jgi:hypothetical protein
MPSSRSGHSCHQAVQVIYPIQAVQAVSTGLTVSGRMGRIGRVFSAQVIRWQCLLIPLRARPIQGRPDPVKKRVWVVMAVPRKKISFARA